MESFRSEYPTHAWISIRDWIFVNIECLTKLDISRVWIEGEIRKITPSGDSISLERGMLTARGLLKGQNNSVDAEIIIVSDGGIGNKNEGDKTFEQAVSCAYSLREKGIGIHFVHIHSPSIERQVNPNGNYYAYLLMNKIGLSKNYNKIEPG